MSMIKLLGNLKVFGTFHLGPIGELVGYNQNSNLMEVIVEVVTKVVRDYSCA